MRISIHQLLDELGVSCSRVDVTEGKFFDRYHIFLEPGEKVSRVLSMAGPLKKALGCQELGFRMYTTSSSIDIETLNIDSDAVAVAGRWDEELAALAERSELPVAIGEQVDGEGLVSIDLGRHPNVIVAGESQDEISGVLECLIKSVSEINGDSVRFCIISPDGRLKDIPDSQRYFDNSYVTTVKEASLMLQDLAEEVSRREVLLYQGGHNDIWEQRHGGSEKPLPYIVLAIDADTFLCDKRILKFLLSLASVGSRVGIIILLGYTTPPNPLVKFYFQTRIACKMSKVQSREALGCYGAECLLPERHDHLLYKDGNIFRFISFETENFKNND